MKSKHFVAAVQFQPKLCDLRHNVSILEQLIFEAAVKGAKIICLPSLATSGFDISSPAQIIECAQQKHGPQTKIIAEIARKFQCFIVFGYPELYEGLLYNSAAIIGPHGLEGNIRKHNLEGKDYFWAAPSSDFSLFASVPTPWGNLGVVIGRDIENKQRQSHPFRNENLKFYYPGSIDTLCVLGNWYSNQEKPNHKYMELSEQLGCNIILSQYFGESYIIDKESNIWSNGLMLEGDCVVGGEIII